jgi:hypothetical protein
MWEVKVTVEDKACKADATYTLLAGQIEFKMLS